MGPNIRTLNTYRVGVGDEGFADVGDLGTARDGHAKKEGGGKRHNESGHCCILKSVVDDSDATDWNGWLGGGERDTAQPVQGVDQTHTEMGIQKGAALNCAQVWEVLPTRVRSGSVRSTG
jgi:hypothetical protein